MSQLRSFPWNFSLPSIGYSFPKARVILRLGKSVCRDARHLIHCIRRAAIQGYSGSQPGDPVRAAEAILQAVEAPEPPLHLLLGRPAYDQVTANLKAFSAGLEQWREVTLAADYPAAG